MKHSWRVVQWLRTRPHPKCQASPWLKEYYDRNKCIIETQTGKVVNLVLTVLTPNQPLASHTQTEATWQHMFKSRGNRRNASRQKPSLLPSLFVTRKTRPWLRRNMSCHSRLHMPELAQKEKLICPLHPWHLVTHHWLTFPSDIATKMLQCIWQKSRQWTRPWKGLKIPAKMAISHATKWHQCKEGCLGCSCGDWCWTAVLANLNTTDWTHINCQP